MAAIDVRRSLASSNSALRPQTPQRYVFVYTPNHRFSDFYPPVSLDENNTVQLGDFGLSKALAQMSFDRRFLEDTNSMLNLSVSFTRFLMGYRY